MSYLGGFDSDDTGAARSVARTQAPAPVSRPAPAAPAPSYGSGAQSSYSRPAPQQQPSYAPVRKPEPIGSYAASRPVAPVAAPAIRAPEPVSTYTPNYSSPLAAPKPEGRPYSQQTAPAARDNVIGWQTPNAGYGGESARQSAQQQWNQMSPEAKSSFTQSLGNWANPIQAGGVNDNEQGVMAGTPAYGRSMSNLTNFVNDAQKKRESYAAEQARYNGMLQSYGRRGYGTELTTIGGQPLYNQYRGASYDTMDAMDSIFNDLERDQGLGT